MSGWILTYDVAVTPVAVAMIAVWWKGWKS